MGTLLDTSILIEHERGAALDLPEGEVGIAAITLSELLHGAHRGAARERAIREAGIEDLLDTTVVIPFDETVARVHARLWADLAGRGAMVGPHDLQIAATAVALGWELATLDRVAFSRVPGLRLRAP
ncbi:MAG TPA: PIN domain-containing protein [Candidatus Limnocylindria bacterium]